MFNKAFLLLIFTLGSVILQAQSTDENEIEEMEADQEEADTQVGLMEFSFDFVNPTGNFKDYLNKDLGGFSFSIMGQTRSKNYSFFGMHLSRYSLGTLSADINDGGFSYNDRSSTKLWTFQGIFRQYTPFYFKIVEPFVELGLGPQFIYTGTTTTFFDEDSTTEFNFDETGLGMSYSISVGFNCKIVDQVFASVKFGFYGGTSTAYLVPQESVTTEFPINSFSLRSSQLNYLKVQIGAAYAF